MLRWRLISIFWMPSWPLLTNEDGRSGVKLETSL